MIVGVTVECDEPQDDPHARRARLKIGGVTIFEETVYDTDPAGDRTEEWARRNLLLLFAHELGKVLDE